MSVVVNIHNIMDFPIDALYLDQKLLGMEDVKKHPSKAE